MNLLSSILYCLFLDCVFSTPEYVLLLHNMLIYLKYVLLAYSVLCSHKVFEKYILETKKFGCRTTLGTQSLVDVVFL